MSAAMKALEIQLAERQRAIAQKTAEIVPMLAAIPEGTVDPEIVGFVERAHDEAVENLQKIRSHGNGKNGVKKNGNSE